MNLTLPTCKADTVLLSYSTLLNFMKGADVHHNIRVDNNIFSAKGRMIQEDLAELRSPSDQ